MKTFRPVYEHFLFLVEIKISLKMIEIQRSSKTKITVSSKRYINNIQQILKLKCAEICKEMNDYNYTYNNKHNLSSKFRLEMDE